MRETSPVIQLAKERALFRFSTLAARMVQDAAQSLAQMAPAAGSQQEQKTISLSREFLQDQGGEFLKQLNASYCSYVERGMQTMYRDLRRGLHEISSDTLTLVDDDTVVRQIEVERRVLRLRDADQQSLGRLNLMIAQIHGEHDVRERENPFRPYLMARALYDVLVNMTSTTGMCTMLFDHLSGALCNHLPEYFAAIRAVFESHGVYAQLLARPSGLTRRDREMLAHRSDMLFPSGAPARLVLPTLQDSPALGRVLSLLNRQEADGGAMSSLQAEGASLQDFVWKIFHQSGSGKTHPGRAHPGQEAASGRRPTETPRLLARLQQLQQKALQETRAADAPLPDLHAELEIEGQADDGGTERITIDVVALVFDFIAADETLCDACRAEIVRLRAPFLKAALVEPDVLQSPAHPFRRLLNRLGALAAGLDPDVAPGTTILAEIGKAVERVLGEFQQDGSLFDAVLAQLDLDVSRALRTCDGEVAGAADALETAGKNLEQFDAALAHTAGALRERLSTLETDPRAADFIVKTWSRVLVHVSQHAEIDLKPYLDAVPELIWSVQVHLDAGERGALLRLLPRLAARLREGVALIGMPESESRPILDELVAMHAQVLRAVPDPLKHSMRLGSLVQHFAQMKIGGADETVMALHAPTIPTGRLLSSLQRFGVTARTWADSDIGMLTNEDAKWLAGMRPGTSIEWWSDWSDVGYLPATLMWVDDPQSFYLFRIDPGQRLEGQPGLLVYSSISLIRALREGSVGLLEGAPLFERAIESMLAKGHARPLEDVA